MKEVEKGISKCPNLLLSGSKCVSSCGSSGLKEYNAMKTGKNEQVYWVMAVVWAKDALLNEGWLVACLLALRWVIEGTFNFLPSQVVQFMAEYSEDVNCHLCMKRLLIEPHENDTGKYYTDHDHDDDHFHVLPPELWFEGTSLFFEHFSSLFKGISSFIQLWNHCIPL